MNIFEVQDTNKDKTNEISIIVMSSDGYKHFWRPFISLYNKNFKNSAKPYIFSNNISFEYEGVCVTPLGDIEWSSRLRKALKQINTNYVLFMLEDYFISAPVDDSNFRIIVNSFIQNDLNYLKLNMNHLGSRGFKKTRKVVKMVDYEISLQPSIWNKEYLLSSLPDYPANAWQVEQHLNIMTSSAGFNSSGCYILAYNILRISHGAVKGEFLPTAKWVLKKHDIEIESKDIKNMSTINYVKLLFRIKIKSIIPRFLYMRIKRLLRKLNFKLY